MRIPFDIPNEHERPRDLEIPKDSVRPHEITLPSPDISPESLQRLREVSAENHFPEIPPRRYEPKQQDSDPGVDREVERQPRRTRPMDHDLTIGLPLRKEEVKLLTEVGRFRVIAGKDLAEHVYGGDRRALESDLRYLAGKDLISIDQVNARRDGIWRTTEKIEVVTLRPVAKPLVHQVGELAKGQHIYVGLVKPREVEHDTQIYRAYLKEVERIEKLGGTNPRVQLDFEIKRMVQQAIYTERKADPARDLNDIKREVAEQSQLPYLHNQIQIPDARITYELDQGSRTGSVDIEVLTGAYRPSHLRSKAQAGFALYASSRDRGRLGKDIEDDHHILHEILDLG